jgi:hypothetical protein
MSRLERLVLLAFFALVLAGLLALAPVAGALGAVGGAAAGFAVVPRLGRLRSRVDATLGADAPVTGLRPRRLGARVVAQLAVLAGLLVTTILIPFIGDELFAAAAAAATGFPFVVTAARLRR